MKSVRETHQSFSKLASALVLLLLLIAAIAVPPRKVSAEDRGFQREFTIPDPGLVTETLVVSGVSSPITTMSLTITGFTSPRPDDLDLLLIAPDGVHNLEFMSDAGTTTATGPITFTLSDTGATFIPDAALIVNGTTYKPGDYAVAEPASDFGFGGTVNHAQTNGVATFTTAFGAASGLATANGTWTLKIVDDASGGGTSTITKWSLTINGTTAADSNIGGVITDNNGSPVAGAVVSLNGGQERKTITDSHGRYNFDSVETNEFYTVTPTRANYSFSPSNRSFSALGSHTDAAFTGSSTGDNANPLDTAEYFVRQQYVDILGREPDEGGFNYWSNEILSCGGDASCTDRRRREVAASFFIAEEFQDTGSFIYDVYKGTLGRKPVFNEYSADRKQVVGGSTLTAQKAAFANNFVQRTEFVQKYQGQTTADTFVDALLQNVQQSSQLDLGSQRAGLISQYNSGGTLEQSRSRVLQSLADNGALKQKEYNAAFVLTEYFGYLRRNPEPEGYDFWLNVVTNGDVGNYRGMVCSFITSTEYQQRVSSVVSHSNAECGPGD
jgi:subtilisin-like proprotein convertase family protein